MQMGSKNAITESQNVLGIHCSRYLFIGNKFQFQCSRNVTENDAARSLGIACLLRWRFSV
jgi:hypothetical protein